MVQVLFAEGLVDLGPPRRRWSTASTQVGSAWPSPFTPEAVEAPLGSPPTPSGDLARGLAAAPAGAVYGRIGTCNQEFGTLASWLVEVLNILTGNLDRAGGSMFSDPVALVHRHGAARRTRPTGWAFGRWTSRVRGAPEVLGQYPVSCLAEEIATPGEGRSGPS